MSSGVKPSFKNNKKQENSRADFLDAYDSKKGVGSQPKTRELEKTNWIVGSKVEGTSVGIGLADLDQNDTYDQFKNKRSTYHDNLYNTEIDESKLTKE